MSRKSCSGRQRSPALALAPWGLRPSVMGHAHDVQEELREPARALRRAIPDVSKECDGCIASHARGAVRTGATESEVAEALGVAIAMDGGPGTVYGPRAFAAFREFAKEVDSRQG